MGMRVMYRTVRAFLVIVVLCREAMGWFTKQKNAGTDDMHHEEEEKSWRIKSVTRHQEVVMEGDNSSPTLFYSVPMSMTANSPFFLCNYWIAGHNVSIDSDETKHEFLWGSFNVTIHDRVVFNHKEESSNSQDSFRDEWRRFSHLEQVSPDLSERSGSEVTESTLSIFQHTTKQNIYFASFWVPVLSKEAEESFLDKDWLKEQLRFNQTEEQQRETSVFHRFQIGFQFPQQQQQQGGAFWPFFGKRHTFGEVWKDIYRAQDVDRYTDLDVTMKCIVYDDAVEIYAVRQGPLVGVRWKIPKDKDIVLLYVYHGELQQPRDSTGSSFTKGSLIELESDELEARHNKKVREYFTTKVDSVQCHFLLLYGKQLDQKQYYNDVLWGLGSMAKYNATNP
mmetsp:Transcript_5010/g.10363  ORF Transcript_5010/g.10363 Transcript_5010/m.10363 type:complete len:393 (-) Transcript_5010:50-1228(-)